LIEARESGLFCGRLLEAWGVLRQNQSRCDLVGFILNSIFILILAKRLISRAGSTPTLIFDSYL